MNDSVFTKIIRGEIPSYKLYEDDKTIVIVPLHPVAKCHILVIPKTQVDKFYDLPQEDYDALMATVKEMSKKVEEQVEAKRVGIVVDGTGVPHAHVHIIAFDTVKQLHEIKDESAPPDTAKQEEIAKLLSLN